MSHADTIARPEPQRKQSGPDVLRDEVSSLWRGRFVTAAPPDVRKWLRPSVKVVPLIIGAAPRGHSPETQKTFGSSRNGRNVYKPRIAKN